MGVFSALRGGYRRISRSVSRNGDGPPPPYAQRSVDDPSSSNYAEVPSTLKQGVTPFEENQEEPPPKQEGDVTKQKEDFNLLERLENYDTVFLIDDSWSMLRCDGHMGRTRMAEAQLAIEYIAGKCTDRDRDGVDIYFMKRKIKNSRGEVVPAEGASAAGCYRHVRDPDEIMRICKQAEEQLADETLLLKRLEEIIGHYLKEYDKNKEKPTPLNLIVITDGIPQVKGKNAEQAKQDVVDFITNAAAILEKWGAHKEHVGIQFFQVGRDKEATEFLTHLDSGLVKNGKDKKGRPSRDIVDFCTFSYEADGTPVLDKKGIRKAVLGGVDRTVDEEYTRNRALEYQI